MIKKSYLSILSFFLLLNVLSSKAIAADEWYVQNPSCVIDRGNPGRTGEYLLTKPVEKFHRVRWFKDFDSSLVQPVCYKNLMISSNATATNLNTGKQEWNQAVPQIDNDSGLGVYKDKILVVGGSVKSYLNKGSSDRFALALIDPDTKKLALGINGKNGETEGVYSPLVYNDVAYVALKRGVFAYDLKALQLLWQFDLPPDKEGYPTQMSPLSTDGERIYTGDSAHYLFAIDMKTGKLAWSLQGIGLGANYAIIAKGKIYIGFTQAVDIYDAKTGKLLRKLFIGKDIGQIIAVSDGKLFFKNLKTIAAADEAAGKELWKIKCDAIDLIINKNILYTMCLKGDLEQDGDYKHFTYAETILAIESTTGKILWKYKISFEHDGERYAGAYLMPYQDALYVISGNRHVLAID